MKDIFEAILIKDKKYTHVKTREYTPVSVYRNQEEFLRIGPKELITPELELHKRLLSYDFPIPNLLTEGEIEEGFYYIEKSLGENLLGDIFWEDCKNVDQISKEHFQSFLNLSERFAEAQLKTAQPEKDFESFYIGIHANYIQEELIDIKQQILQAFEKLKERTSNLPTVLTHGDFNAYNLFEKGVIDFGSMHNAPAGYDLVTNIYHTYNFPKTGDFESMRRYEFTSQQISEYINAIDKIYVENDLEALSEYQEDFIIAKTIWATSRMQSYPKIQKWRYDRFRKMLSEYLSGNSIMDTTLNFR